MIMSLPHNKHELYTKSSFFGESNDLNRSLVSLGHSFCTFHIILENARFLNEYFELILLKSFVYGFLTQKIFLELSFQGIDSKNLHLHFLTVL